MIRPAILALALAACDASQAFEPPELSLERMIDQPRVGAFDEPMREPPPGAVPHDRASTDPSRESGTAEDGTWLTRPPFEATRTRLENGRRRFEIVCATCHGITGTGESVVASKMALRKPPSLHEGRLRVLPIGQIYDVIRHGYGLMPPFGASLDVDERWDVALYVKALELSRAADVASLPPDVRRELAERAP